MMKKDMLVLLLPGALWVLLSAALMTGAVIVHNAYKNDQEYEQKFQDFVTDVESGRTQLSAEKMLEQVRRSHAVAASERDMTMSCGRGFEAFALLAAAGFMSEVVLALHFKRRLREAAGG
jgi:hypothetical protein